MNKGKDICKELKAVRKQIAEENGIELEIPECTYDGPCKGTCPRCDSEVRFLENALADRLRKGKVATVAGIALALASPAVATAQEADKVPVPPSHERQTGLCEVTGTVTDGRSRERVPYANVKLWRDSAHVALTAATDMDGHYGFAGVPEGHYTLEVSAVGYAVSRREVEVKGPATGVEGVELASSGIVLDEVQIICETVGLVAVQWETKGTVVDGLTKEPLPFVNIIVKQEGKLVAGATTDFDGGFSIALEEGEYEFKVSSIGYASRSFPVKVPDGMPMKAIELEVNGALLEQMGILTEDDLVPLIDPTTSGIQSGSEVDGVKLRIQY